MKRIASLAAVLVASAPALAWAQEPLPPPEPPPAAAPAPGPASGAAPAAAPAPAPAAAPAPVVVAPPPRGPVVVLGPPGAEGEERPGRAEGPPRYDFIRFGFGPRFAYVGSEGFDTFADSDLLASVALDASMTVLTKGKLSLAAGLAWDVGGRDDGLRGFSSSLTAHRFTAPIEGRYHVTPWLYGFGKLAPGAAFLRAKIDDNVSPRLTDSAWAFAGDLSVGASVLAVGHGDRDRRKFRLWVTPEIGYSLTTSADLRPSPGRDEEDVLGSDQSARLRSTSLSGVFWRLTASVTF